MSNPVKLSNAQREILLALATGVKELMKTRNEFPYIYVLRSTKHKRGGVCFRASPILGLITRGLLAEDGEHDLDGNQNVYLTPWGHEVAKTL